MLKNFNNLFESITNKERDKAFQLMADTQRNGKPESLGANNPNKYFKETLGDIAEHIGDLTHRLGNDFENFSFIGYKSAKEKIDNKYNQLVRIAKPYSLSSIDKSTLNDKILNYYILSNSTITKDILKSIKDNGKDYANAHQTIPVYNKIQWLARQCAIDIGNFNFTDYAKHLTELHELSKDEFIKQASEYNGKEYKH